MNSKYQDLIKVNSYVNNAASNTKDELTANLDPQERRGAGYRDKNGERVKLTGRDLVIPVNGYELCVIKTAAAKLGITLASYVRMIVTEKAKEQTGL